MNNDGSDIVRMSFKGGDLFGSIVVVHPQLEIVRAADDPILARNEAPSTNWYICKLKSLKNCLLRREHSDQAVDDPTHLCFKRPDVDVP